MPDSLGGVPVIGGLRVAAFWRQAAAVTEVLGTAPEPGIDDELSARCRRPLPCMLNPVCARGSTRHDAGRRRMMYLFTCATCEPRPLAGDLQLT